MNNTLKATRSWIGRHFLLSFFVAIVVIFAAVAFGANGEERAADLSALGNIVEAGIVIAVIAKIVAYFKRPKGNQPSNRN